MTKKFGGDVSGTDVIGSIDVIGGVSSMPAADSLQGLNRRENAGAECASLRRRRLQMSAGSSDG